MLKRIQGFFLLVALTSTLVFGQTANVFFSEYIEGTSTDGVYNRALEIYNGTGNDLDMSAFIIKSGYSGNENLWNSEVYTFPEGTVLGPGEVWVMANNGACEEILAVANDTIYYRDYGYVMAFSGDDARGLFQIVGSDTVLIDIIGVEGSVPENGGWDVAGVPNATLDHTLVRKSSVASGCTDWATSAGTDADNSQWIVYDIDTFDYLGSHIGPNAVEENTLVKNFTLLQNYPNPFNPSTTITYSIPFTKQNDRYSVLLQVFNVTGKKVATLVNAQQSSGEYSVQFNAENLPSGTYFYTLRYGDNSVTKKMLLLK
jgi:hypothetical protein